MASYQIFESVFNAQSSLISPLKFVICLAAAVFFGAVLAVACCIGSDMSRRFAAALALLPAAVCAVIIAVNGNIGAGVAVAGAFGLVRFRSAPGGAREICAVFIAMGTGLICGVGYIAYAAVFTLIMGVFFVVYAVLCSALEARDTLRILRITVPEDISYTEAFDDIFSEYTKSCRLTGTKTYAMGTMYRLKYEVRLKKGSSEKDFIDALRCRNGNLEISLSFPEDKGNEL